MRASTGAALWALLAATPALAQEKAEPSVLNEVIVTGSARAERLQEVPVSVTVLSKQDIQDRGITSIGQILATAPNVNFNNSLGLGGSFFSMRGQTQERYAPPPIAIVVDGVLEMSAEQFNSDDFLLEQVEILRGPQGPLYGVNAIAGAMNMTTISPGDHFEGHVTARYASGEDKKVSGYVSGPIIPGVLTALVGGNLQDRNGQWRNSVNGTRTDHYEDKTARARLVFTPTETLRMDLKYRYSDTDGEDPSLIISSTNDPSKTNQRPNFTKVGINTRKIEDVSLRTRWDNPLGALDVILSHYNVDEFLIQDFRYNNPFLPVGAFANQNQSDDGYSEEARLTSKTDGPVRWMIGGYHSDFDVLRVTRALNVAPVPLVRSDDADNETYAGFGVVSYDFNDQLRAEGAVRYDHRRVDHVGTVAAGSTVLVREAGAVTFKKWQPKFTLTYKPSSDMSFYASVGRGFRVGDLNPIGRKFGAALVRPETATSYELGAKTQWLDRRLTINGAIFTSDIEDMQFRVFDRTVLASVGFNINKVRSKGVEIEAVWKASDILSLNAGFGYTDSKAGKYRGDLIFGDLTGHHPTRVPKTSANLGFDLTTPATDNINVFLRPQYRYTGHYFWDPQNTAERPVQHQLDVRAGVADSDRKWQLTAFVNNALNDKATSDYQPRTIVAVVADLYATRRKTMVGVQLDLNF